MVVHCLSITIITMLLIDVHGDPHRGDTQSCGGRLKDPVGTIQTPFFPNPFPVPIKCKWIIEHDIVNGTISIYFTQQYITSGLTFTEYMYYDDTYKLGERRALTVTEENITRIKYLQVQSPVLVVELSLDRLEGSQLRALGLLNVFGLNVTYAVRAPPPSAAPAPRTSCSAIECRLLGHCYATHDYTEFFCSCFEGYSGPDCGVGPLCPSTSNLCKNNGTCRQMGPAAVSCICAPGYTGDLCESEITSPKCGIEECSESCRDGRSCDCSPKDTDSLSARFETRLQFVDKKDVNMTEEIVKQITDHLRAANITLLDEIEILNISSADASGTRTVWLRVWGLRREAGSVRSALSRLAAARTLSDSLRLLPATLHFDMQPALSLHKLIINQHPEVWEGGEFILSCMAYGSPNIAFTWYKDGVKINFNGTSRDIWSRTVAEDALGRRMSVLGVSEAKRPDRGRWSCAAADGGRRRCSALRLAVSRPPDLVLVPSTLTVNKGDNVSITCLAGAGRMHGTLGFSWAREKSLLALAPGKEVWEDLYPAGSVLKLYNVQKSGEYSCQVSSAAGTNSKAVAVWALSPADDVCPGEAAHGIRWPPTAPGAHGIRWPPTAPGARAVASCPAGYSGETTRFCEPRTSQIGVKWSQPNFSGCVDDSLQDIYEEFIRISYGYSWARVHDVARRYGAVLRSRFAPPDTAAVPPGTAAAPPNTAAAPPGAAAAPLRHAAGFLRYLRSPVARVSDRTLSAEPLLRIYDTLLKYPDGFLDEQKIYELQNAVVEAATMKNDLNFSGQEFEVQSSAIEDNKAHFTFPLTLHSEEWLLTSVDVELAGSGNVSMAVVHYKDLTSRLPSLRRSIELIGGREVEYHMASLQSQVGADSGPDGGQYTVTLLFSQAKNSSIESKLACALRSPSEPSAWATSACEVRVPEPGLAACRCRGPGSFALFTVARSALTDAEKELSNIVTVAVSVGGAMCLVAGGLQLAGAAGGRGPRVAGLLRAAAAGAHGAALLALLHCDTRQEEPCPGPYGWVCAACWGVGGAALCAQPLLLQAELAGRTQRASSVAILAGVSTLAWLSARLWGGHPLRLGAAAQAVCAAGGALLSLLCLALALGAALRLRTLMRKVPPERRAYLRDRARVVRHTLVLLCTTTAAQAAGVASAQPGGRRPAPVAALAAAALANGLAMFLCYVVYDDSGRALARRLASPAPGCWRPRGDVTLSLYIKQGCETESRGGRGFEASSSPVTPLSSYWRFESPSKINRNLSTPSQEDSRADIVRSVEYKTVILSPQKYGPKQVTTRVLCDLIPQPEHMDSEYIELGVPKPPDIRETKSLLPQTAYNISEPNSIILYKTHPILHNKRADYFDIPQESCSLCVRSNPDISKYHPKSCLKKSKAFKSNISLPTDEAVPNTIDIESVNRKWNKAYETSETDQIVINKISHDLDYLLNRHKCKENNQIKEAPT